MKLLKRISCCLAAGLAQDSEVSTLDECVSSNLPELPKLDYDGELGPFIVHKWECIDPSGDLIKDDWCGFHDPWCSRKVPVVCFGSKNIFLDRLLW